MKELMREMFGIMQQYDYGELVEYVGLSSEDYKKHLTQNPLKQYWNSPSTQEDSENQEKLISLHEELLNVADSCEQYSEEDSDANHYTYFPFKSKTSDDYYVFLQGWNSWSDPEVDVGVYKVNPKQVTQYSIAYEK